MNTLLLKRPVFKVFVLKVSVLKVPFFKVSFTGTGWIKKAVFALIVPALMMESTVAWSQAYCALRDPQHGIYELFPEATNYRSIVKVIDESVKQAVEKRLPPQSLHFSELGRHTLYVAMKNQKALGFVHVRSEESQWGLVEVAWAMDMDLRVRNFDFQRCRTGKKRMLEHASFRNQLRGKSFSDLVTLLKPGTSNLDFSKIKVPAGAEKLAEVLIRNGLKTTLVTELAWQSDIAEIQLSQKAALVFVEPDSHSSDLRVEKVNNPFSESVVARLKSVLSGGTLGTDDRQVMVSRVHDASGKFLGSLYKSAANINGKPATLWWAIGVDNVVKNIDNSQGWANPRDARIFANLVGRKFEASEECGNRAELLALEATIVANHSVIN